MQDPLNTHTNFLNALLFGQDTTPAVQAHAGPVCDAAVIKLECACGNKTNEMLLIVITA